jgi:hypothetical protein
MSGCADVSRGGTWAFQLHDESLIDQEVMASLKATRHVHPSLSSMQRTSLTWEQVKTGRSDPSREIIILPIPSGLGDVINPSYSSSHKSDILLPSKMSSNP